MPTLKDKDVPFYTLAPCYIPVSNYKITTIKCNETKAQYQRFVKPKQIFWSAHNLHYNKLFSLQLLFLNECKGKIVFVLIFAFVYEGIENELTKRK